MNSGNNERRPSKPVSPPDKGGNKQRSNVGDNQRTESTLPDRDRPPSKK